MSIAVRGTRRLPSPFVSQKSTVTGHVAPGWERVRDTFRASFERGEERGASVAMFLDGEPVVDLWGGFADVERARPWERDTLTTVFSCTKALVAVCFLALHERGLVDYDAPVVRYWPEFAQGGKEQITVRTLLGHRAGLHALDTRVGLDDIEHRLEWVDEVLARQAPAWSPGRDQGYHGVTYGLYGGALFRRIAGESVGTFLRREITDPLEADAFIGLPVTREIRVAINYPTTTRERLTKVVPDVLFRDTTEGRVFRSVARGGDARGAFANPPELGPAGLPNFNTRRVHALELPWGNGVANARGLGRIMAALSRGGELGGVRIMRPETAALATPRDGWSTRDRVLQKPLGWTLGFLKEETHLFSPNPESFGHSGAGGALAWCDPTRKLAIGYAMNKMDHHIRSPRAVALCHAAYACLGAS